MKDLINLIRDAITSAIYGNESSSTAAKINKLADQEEAFLGSVQYIRRL